MAKKKIAATSNPFNFASGIVQDRNTVRVVAHVKQLQERGSTASRLMRWTRSDRQWASYRLEWTATRIACLNDPLTILATGPKGIVYFGTAGANSEEHVDPSDDGPKHRGDVRDMRLCGANVYAVGMGRQVYRRGEAGVWCHEDAGVVTARGEMSVAGFNSIDSVSGDDLIAVGFAGEIWTRQQGSWRKRNSPTNVVLHKVRVVRPDLIFVCGRKGILLVGCEDAWRIIRHGVHAANFWGMEWFDGRLFVAAETALFVLQDDETLMPVTLSAKGGVTARHLHAQDGLLLSVGEENIFDSVDGVHWTELSP